MKIVAEISDFLNNKTVRKTSLKNYNSSEIEKEDKNSMKHVVKLPYEASDNEAYDNE